MDTEKLPMSKRLLMNAALVPECSVFADIGCDHAYTCLYLVAAGTAGQALAMDVKSGPLMRAKENIERYGFSGRVRTRLSDGLKELSVGEADCILISGMGGLLTIDILERGWEKVLAAKCIVLQPQSEIAQVRKFLHKMGYHITAEWYQRITVWGGSILLRGVPDRKKTPGVKGVFAARTCQEAGDCGTIKRE